MIPLYLIFYGFYKVYLHFSKTVLLFPQRSDYINASFMDGYKHRNAYIGTQGTRSTSETLMHNSERMQILKRTAQKNEEGDALKGEKYKGEMFNA